MVLHYQKERKQAGSREENRGSGSGSGRTLQCRQSAWLYFQCPGVWCTFFFFLFFSKMVGTYSTSVPMSGMPCCGEELYWPSHYFHYYLW